MKLNYIAHANCQPFLYTLPAQSIDTIITSPPYKDKDGFNIELLKDIAGNLYRVLKKDRTCFINFGQLADFKDRPFYVVDAFINAGFRLHDTIIWVKNHYRPIQGKRRLNNLFEYIFMFAKGRPTINRLAIGIPYADSSNAKRFNDGLNLKCRGNVWHIPYETIQKEEQKLHNDRFPVELPQLCIRLANPAGGVVLDPFLGSGSTAVAAIREEAPYVGIEISEHYVQVSKQRIQRETKE